MIDLKSFCGTRTYLSAPFSNGEFTYATNGHIMVRVPRLPDVSDITIKGNWEKPLNGIDAATFAPFLHRPLPQMTDEECSKCGGTGNEHDCPDCSCDCDGCGGSGKQAARVSTTVASGIFNLRYIAMALALPAVEFMTSARDEEGPLLFRFDGGVGAVMPMRSQYDTHVELAA